MKSKSATNIKKTVTIDYENKRLSVFYFLPLLLIAGFVPLIVYAKYIDLTGTTQALYWTGQQQYLDFFSYWKSRWVIVLTAIALIFYIVLYIQKKLPLKNLKQYYVPLGFYAIFAIISTISAVDTQTALWGFVDMYQGMFVLLSYVIITFLTINFVNNERDVNLFAKAFLFLMIVEGIIGVTQYFGFDFFQTGLGKSLIVPGNIQVDGLSFSFGPKTIYGTLFNTNFVGSFATLMLPLSVAFLLGAKTKKQRIFSTIAVVFMIFVLIGCNSRAGYVGVAISAILGLWLFRKVIIKYWKISVEVVSSALVILFVINFLMNGALLNRLINFNIFEEFNTAEQIYNENIKFEDIQLGKDNFSIKTNFETLNFKIDGDKLFFMDENNKELIITTNGNKIKINDERYAKYDIVISETYPGVSVTAYWRNINFYFTNQGVKILGSGGRIAEPVTALSVESLDKYGRIASNRFYIWARTLPMIRNSLFSGSGPDNFPISFPQDDFVAKMNVGMDASMVIDKPHNMFMQISINTGIGSLITLLILWGIYIVSSLKLFTKIIYNSLYKYLGASCLISVIGYLATGIFNDQVISVAPLFWIILGLGISINYKLRNTIKTEVKE